MHNNVSVCDVLPIDHVSVGKGSYGVLQIASYNPDVEYISIGNYVSIAKNVLFMGGGNHSIHTLTTYPLSTLLCGVQDGRDAQSKGTTVVEDEVWIGLDALILSGVRIGKGAIIGARSVVTRDVPPYAIVGGNPAKVIKYRFPQEIIDVLLPFDLSEIPEETLKKNIEVLYQKINSVEDARRIISILSE